MISNVAPCELANDNYGRLARYIADASHAGEKCLMSWCAGCADEDYDFSVHEVADVQAMNVRTTKKKTYHLVVSFRPEDAAGLTPEVYKTIETRFAAALGFSEHQRHCGVHKNTGNLHMHIAYNMIHPGRFTRREPYRDYIIRDRLCQALELEFGLAIDNRRGQKLAKGLEPGAARMEAHTGQLSFEGYAQQHKDELMQAMRMAATWEDVHMAFGRRGMELAPHGNGLAARDLYNPKNAKHAMKASALDRSLSLKKLEARFGAFCAPAMPLPGEQSRYEAIPLHRAPERGDLYAEYQQGISQRRKAMTEIKDQLTAKEAAIAAKWAEKRRLVARAGLNRAAQFRLLKLARVREAEEALKPRKEAQARRKEVIARIPYASWMDFLRQKATHQGSEVALAILRSRKNDEPDTVPMRTWSDLDAQAETLRKQKDILANPAIPGHAKPKLINVAMMLEVAPGAKVVVDKKGTLIFTLEDGGTIRDNGKQVFFSPQVEDRATLYAQKKWGKRLLLGNGVIASKRALEQSRKKQEMGL